MGGPNGWSDVLPWLQWLYADFPSKVDVASALGGVVLAIWAVQIFCLLSLKAREE